MDRHSQFSGAPADASDARICRIPPESTTGRLIKNDLNTAPRLRRDVPAAVGLGVESRRAAIMTYTGG